MWRWRALVALSFALLAMDARAQSNDPIPYVEFEEGAYPFDEKEEGYWSVRNAASVRPLFELGPDALRFTFDAGSALRKSYVFELRRVSGHALLEIVWLDRRPLDARRGTGWQLERRERFRISLSDYEDLARLADHQLARGQTYQERLDRGDESWLCNDGHDLLTERIVDGRQVWMTGDCGVAHPNHLVDRRLRDFALDRLGGPLQN